MTTLAKFSMFEIKLNPAAYSCFKMLLDNVRDGISAGRRGGDYEIPVASFLERNDVDDVQTVADAIREIIQCRVEIQEGEFLYFYNFFSSVSIENGVVKYTLPPEVEKVVPSATLAANA